MATQPTDTGKARQRTLGDELAVIAQRAQAFTNASGTAVALSEGNADEIVCRARSGSAAPDVGTALRVEGTFTGLCIQSGKELRCDDAETDTRVDTAAIRALGIRSMVVTPIREDNRVVGVLACFAPTAHAFTITHVAVLKTMADQISVLLHKDRRAKHEGTQPESAPLAPKPVASAPLPAPVVIKPTSSGSAVAAVRAPAVARVEPIKADVAAPVPFPKREEKHKPEPKPEIKANFGTFDSVGAESKKPLASPKMMMVGAAAVLVMAAVSTFFVVKSRRHSTAVPVQQAQETNAASSEPSQVQTAAAVPPPAPAESSNGVIHAAANTAKSAAPPAANPKPEHVAANTAKNPPPPPEKPAPVEKPSPTTVAITSGPSKLSASVSAPQNNAVAISPTLSMSTPSGSLSALARPVSSGAPAIAQSDLEPMRVLKTVPPTYPAIARVRRLAGSVVVQVTVGKDGKVHNPQLVSGQPVFRDAAFDAVKQWQFKPATLNGQPIEQVTDIKMDFKP